MNLFTRTRQAVLGAILGSAVLGTGAWAQTTALRFKPSSLSLVSGTYTAVSGSATLVSVAPDNDEGLSGAQAIGFTFPFNGQNMTHFILSSNGWIKLGTSAGMAAPSGALPGGAAISQLDINGAHLSDTTSDKNIIAPMNVDLLPNTGSPIDPFSYETTGSPGSRVCTIQWKNMKNYTGTAGNEIYATMNFQAKLYEGTGRIEFVYGTFTAGTNANTTSAGFMAVGMGVKGDDETTASTLVLIKGSTGAWSTTAARYFLTQASGTTAQGFNLRSRVSTTPFAVNATYAPTSGQTFRLDPVSPYPGTLPYSPITVDTSTTTFTDLTAGSLGSTISTANFDDANSAETDIGFTFSFGSTTFNKFILNTNGYIKLGNAGMSAPTSNLFLAASGIPATGTGAMYSAAAVDQYILAPYNMDLIAGSAPEYRVYTTGTVGNRICTIQWTKVKDKVSASGVDGGASVQLYNDITFQVRLYESASRIEFAYGNFSNTASSNRKTVVVGVKGANDLNPQIVVANPASSSANTWGTINWSRTHYGHYAFYNVLLTGNIAGRVPTVGRTLVFPLSYPNDLRADIVYSLGKLPALYGNPTNIRAVVRNVGDNDYAGGGTASMTITGANSGSGSATIPALLAGETAVLDFGDFTLSNLGNTNLALGTPSDDNVGNNTKSWTVNVNSNTYSYKNPLSGNSGGVGFTGGTGVFVAKFSSSSTNTLNSVKVDFNGSGGIQYQLVVYADNAGVPGALRYLSPVYTSPAGGGTATLSICPSLSVTGAFYVGVRQFGTTNVGFSYQSENPIRSGAFFYTSPVANGGAAVNDASTGWLDFQATNSPFRFSIEALLEVASSAPNCAITPSPADASTFVNRTPSLTWSAPGSGSTPSTYDVYFGTSPSPALVSSNVCGNSYTPVGTLAANQTYYWKVISKNVAGAATGCSTWSFTTAPIPSNDSASAAALLTPCTAAVNGFTNNATQSLAAINCNGADNANDDVWYTFVANSATHRVRVTPVDAIFDPVIDFRTNAYPGVNLACQNLRPAGFAEDLVVTGLTPGTGYRIRVYGVGAAGTEGRFTIRISTDGGWVGTTTDWNDANNWCDVTVPTASTNAQIRVAPANPTLNNNTSVLNLTVDAGTTLTVTGGNTLTVRNDGSTGGTLAGGGTINGSVVMSTAGSQAQNVNTTGATVQNLRFQNTTGINILNGATLNISNSLLSTSSAIVNNGLITFKSTPSGTAYLGSLAGSTYSGTGYLAQERYMTGSARWVFLGAPVQNATLNQWSELSPSILPLNNASVFWFQETDSSRTVTNGGAVAEINGWRVPTALANGINPGGVLRGYRAYVRNGFLTGSTPVVSVFGNPYVGNVVATLTKTAGQYYGGGYNLIANPYMSAVDFDAVVKGGGVNNAFFVYNGAVGNYQVYVGSGGFNEGVALNAAGPNPNHIPSSQAFFMRTAVNNATVTFSEAHKVANATANFYRTGPVADRLRIAARDAAGHKDEAVIRFRQGATEGFDVQGDAGALGADYVSVSSVIAGSTETMDVNTLPLLGARRSVFLSVRATSNGTYAMDFSELESFESYMDILLVDHLTGTTTNLRNQASYTFQVTSNPASQGTRRFEVIFNDARVTAVKPTVGGAALSAWPNPASADQHIMVSVSGSLTGAADLQVFDAAGRLMHTQQVTLTGDANQAYELGAQLAAGAYTVRCTTASASMSTRLVVNK